MTTNKKTVAQIVDEYKKRQEKPQYSSMGVVGIGDKDTWTFSDVTNLVDTYEDDYEKIEFDCEHNNIKEHVKMIGTVTRTFQVIDE
jgi:hypothetical protein